MGIYMSYLGLLDACSQARMKNMGDLMTLDSR